MSDTTALTLIAVSTAVMAISTIVVIVATLRMAVTMNELARQVKELTEEIRRSTLSTLADVRSSAQAVGQVAAVAGRLARPLLAATAIRGMPKWVRRAGLLAGVATVARQAFLAVVAGKPPTGATDGSTAQDGAVVEGTVSGSQGG